MYKQMLFSGEKKFTSSQTLKHSHLRIVCRDFSGKVFCLSFLKLSHHEFLLGGKEGVREVS